MQIFSEFFPNLYSQHFQNKRSIYVRKHPNNPVNLVQIQQKKNTRRTQFLVFKQ